MKKEYEINWLHIPTGKTGTKIVNEFNKDYLLRSLNNWNRQPNWKYWY